MINNPFELAQYVGTLLSRKKLKLVTIESCTGGSLAKQITDVPGASEWFDCGLITYSNESKTGLAGVPEDLIRQQGAVSQKVALAMAKGAINVTGSDIALSTTVWCGFATQTGIFSTDKRLFTGNRAEIREQSVLYSLQCLCNYLETGHF